MDPRGTVDRIFKEDYYYTVLHIYISPKYASFIVLNRLRTTQNLATELDLAIVAKMSFKIVYISYIYHNKNTH